MHTPVPPIGLFFCWQFFVTAAQSEELLALGRAVTRNAQEGPTVTARLSETAVQAVACHASEIRMQFLVLLESN